LGRDWGDLTLKIQWSTEISGTPGKDSQQHDRSIPGTAVLTGGYCTQRRWRRRRSRRRQQWRRGITHSRTSAHCASYYVITYCMQRNWELGPRTGARSSLLGPVPLVLLGGSCGAQGERPQNTFCVMGRPRFGLTRSLEAIFSIYIYKKLYIQIYI
jgi:hypothetical protein